MRRVLILFLACNGCGAAALSERARRLDAAASVRAELGDGAGAAAAHREAASLRLTARLHEEKPHGWLWHDLAMR